MSVKRVILSTLLGVVAGIVCYLLSRGNMAYTSGMIAGVILNRTLIGFVIGISGWKKMPYLLHGIIIGLIVTSLMAVYASLQGAIMLLIAGAVYGLLIELIVTKLFKAPK
jgi:hypothetical protein